MFGATNTTIPKTSHKQAVSSKTGYYSMERVLAGSKELQENLKPLHKEMKKAEEELERQNNKLKVSGTTLKKLEDEFATQKANYEKKKKVSSEEAIETMERSMTRLQAEISEEKAKFLKDRDTLRQHVQYVEMQAMQEEQRIRKPIIEKVITITADLLIATGWDALIPIEVPLSERVDVTAELIAELNKTFKQPVAPAATAAKPKVQAV